MEGGTAGGREMAILRKVCQVLPGGGSLSARVQPSSDRTGKAGQRSERGRRDLVHFK